MKFRESNNFTSWIKKLVVYRYFRDLLPFWYLCLHIVLYIYISLFYSNEWFMEILLHHIRNVRSLTSKNPGYMAFFRFLFTTYTELKIWIHQHDTLTLPLSSVIDSKESIINPVTSEKRKGWNRYMHGSEVELLSTKIINNIELFSTVLCISSSSLSPFCCLHSSFLLILFNALLA